MENFICINGRSCLNPKNPLRSPSPGHRSRASVLYGAGCGGAVGEDSSWKRRLISVSFPQFYLFCHSSSQTRSAPPHLLRRKRCAASFVGALPELGCIFSGEGKRLNPAESRRFGGSPKAPRAGQGLFPQLPTCTAAAGGTEGAAHPPLQRLIQTAAN